MSVSIVPSSGSPQINCSGLPAAADYQIYLGNSTGNWTFLADLGALDPTAGGSYLDTSTNIQPDSQYVYGIFDGAGNLLDSATLATSVQISASSAGNTVNLSWNNYAPTLNFILTRAYPSSLTAYLGNASSYTDTGLGFNSWFNYSLNETTVNSWNSIEVWTAPDALDGLSAQGTSTNEINLAPTGWGTGSSGVMNVYRGTTPGFALDADHRIATAVTSFTDIEVQSSTTYYYQATNVNPIPHLPSIDTFPND